jgi:4a-hydroxytetrahydrobiopterin dehydratase
MQVEHWTFQNNTLVRIFEVLDYESAFDFVDEIRMVAEELNHQPEITINTTSVTVKTTTHSSGNTVTEKDVELAKILNQVYEEGLVEEEFEEIDEEDPDESDEEDADGDLIEEIDEEKSV